MKKREILLLALSLALLVCGIAGKAEAQRFSRSCERAESTSDTMVCLKKQVEDAQQKLNDIYKKILEEQPPHVIANLGNTQKSWISYRNDQCSWESVIAESGYKKIYELSCIASLTEERIKALTAMQSLMQSDRPREFASHPRWMNALAADYPDVFWRYGQWLQADLDCNGTEEEIMTGVAIEGYKDAKGNSAGDAAGVLSGSEHTYKAEAVIALSENVRTGRSKTTIFRLPISGGDAENSFCNVPLGLEIIQTENHITNNAQGEAEEDTVMAAGNGNCPVRARVLDGNCAPALIYWDGASYQLEKNIDATEAQTGKNEKQTQ